MKHASTKAGLECSHVETGACDRCKDPIAAIAFMDDKEVPTRRASIRSDTKFPPKTDPILRMFMRANMPERARGAKIGRLLFQ